MFAYVVWIHPVEALIFEAAYLDLMQILDVLLFISLEQLEKQFCWQFPTWKLATLSSRQDGVEQSSSSFCG